MAATRRLRISCRLCISAAVCRVGEELTPQAREARGMRRRTALDCFVSRRTQKW